MPGVAARTVPPPRPENVGEGVPRDAPASRILTLSLSLPPHAAGRMSHPGRTEPDA
ncbi:hypothetical protein DWB77_02909 [Streptomyces hundungensis]|uniref:Uncharacterized protein n=1 Tax=Streptomyces hundungensis TaxID=1077946 RepID=A0A387HDP6_9ACTN|nr:hypothetical protein DWB77_02909 [Streptomyces hundungensis]